MDSVTPPRDIYTEDYDRIRRYIANMVRDRADADDLTQETFLRAHSRQETLRDPKSARSWLYRIATNVCLDRLRQREPNAALDAEPASVSPSVQDRTERAETSACVQRCLDFLPDHYRSVILLFEAHGLTAPEIATLLGITKGAVKIRLHRARRKLQEIMEIGCVVSESRQGAPCCESKH